MDTPLTAVAIVVVGVVVAFLGAVSSTRAARRADIDGNEGTRSELAVAVGVAGVVAALFGVSYLLFLVLTEG